MLITIQGIYRDGKIQLAEIPPGVQDDTAVIVTFLTDGDINLSSRKTDEVQAANLRTRMAAFSEEWNSPEMDIYDDYDAAKSNL